MTALVQQTSGESNLTLLLDSKPCLSKPCRQHKEFPISLSSKYSPGSMLFNFSIHMVTGRWHFITSSWWLQLVSCFKRKWATSWKNGKVLFRRKSREKMSTKIFDIFAKNETIVFSDKTIKKVSFSSRLVPKFLQQNYFFKDFSSNVTIVNTHQHWMITLFASTRNEIWKLLRQQRLKKCRTSYNWIWID